MDNQTAEKMPDIETTILKRQMASQTIAGYVSMSFVVAGTMFCSGYVLSLTYPASYRIGMLLLMCAVLVGRLLRHQLKWFRCSRPVVIAYALFIGMFLISMVRNGSDGGYFIILLYLTTAVLTVLNFSFVDFKRTYVTCMKYITIVALIFYAADLLFQIFSYLPIVYNSDYDNYAYRNAWIVFQFVEQSRGPIGIFWEPGVFCSFLLFGILLELYFPEEKSNLRIIFLFSAGVILSRSTAGWLLLPCMIGCQFFRKRSLFGCLGIIGGIGILLSVWFCFQEILEFLIGTNEQLFGKLAELDSKSTLTRLMSPYMNWLICLDAPIGGYGFREAGEKYLELLESNLYGNVDSQTSTSGFFLAGLGLGGGLYTLAWIWGVMKQTYFSIACRISLLTICLIIVNKEPHTYLLCTYMLMFYLLDTHYSPQKSDVSEQP